MPLLQIIQHGWIAMIPLFICSVLVVAVILERWWTFSHIGNVPRELVRRIEGLLSSGNIEEADNLLADYDTPYSRVLRASLRKRAGTEEMDDTLALACEEEMINASRPLAILGTIGNIAPFIGLFGTVIGIMQAFNKIGLHKSSGYNLISQDLAFALIATAFGIGIGIIAVTGNNWGHSWIDKYRLTLERFATEWSYRLKSMIAEGQDQQKTIKISESV